MSDRTRWPTRSADLAADPRAARSGWAREGRAAIHRAVSPRAHDAANCAQLYERLLAAKQAA